MKSRPLLSAFVSLFTLVSTVALGQSSAPPGPATAHPDLVLQVGHAKPVSALAFSPDGKWLASGSDDLTIKIWDLATGSVVRTIQSETRVATLAISPDTKLLAAGHGVNLLSSVSLLSRQQGDGYAIDLWDVATGRKLRTLSSHAFSIQGLAFSRDGRELTSVSGDAIKKWDVDTGAAKTSFTIDYGTHRELFGGLAQAVVSPDGRFAAVAELNKPFKVYDAATGKELTDTGIKADFDTTMTFSPDGRLVAFLLRDRAVIRAFHGGPDLHVLATGVSAFRARGNLIFSPDGRTLVTLRPAVGAADRGEVKVWDVTSGTLAREIGPVVSSGTGPLVSLSPDGQIIAELAGTGMKLIDSVSGREELVLSSEETVPIEETDIYRALINNPRMMASLKKNAGVSTPEEVKTYFETHKEQLAILAASLSSEVLPADCRAQNALTFSPDGRWLVYRHKQMKATRTELWSTSTGVPARVADLASLDSIGEPGLSPDGRFRAAPPGAGAALKGFFGSGSSRQPNYLCAGR